MIRLMMALAIIWAGANAAPAATILGVGNSSCGDWTRYAAFVDRNDNLRERVSAFNMRAWLAGYVSGYNVANDDVDFLAKPSFTALTAWMDNYCKANPLDNVVTAASILIKELRSRAERK